MIYVEDGIINLNRGDDAALTIELTDTNGEEYVMDSSEYLIFGLRETPSEDSELLLEISSDLGSNIIRFRHADTADLQVGFYSAEAQLMLSDGQRITVWPKLTGQARTSKGNRRNFCLMTEVVLS